MALAEQSGSRQPASSTIDRVIDVTSIRSEVIKSSGYRNSLIAVGSALEITGWQGDRAKWDSAPGKYRFVGDAYLMVMYSGSYRHDDSPGVGWFMDRSLYRDRREMGGPQQERETEELQVAVEGILAKDVDRLALGASMRMHVWNTTDVRFRADSSRLGVWVRLEGSDFSVPFRKEDYDKYRNPLHLG